MTGATRSDAASRPGRPAALNVLPWLLSGRLGAILRRDECVPAAHPYYICTPTYRRTSAGIRCLHLLCHHLNRAGHEAYVTFFEGGPAPLLNPDLATPVLSARVLARHKRAGRAAIVVYPEVVPGNPLGGAIVARYVLNYPGLLGGDTEFDSAEQLFFYSKQFAAAYGDEAAILEVPVLDRAVFNPFPERERKGTCFYAMKYQHDHHGQQVFGLPAGSVEITRDRPGSQTPAEIADLFRSSEAFYCFENTALGTEAILCHCPTIMMPNPFLRKPQGLVERDWDGLAWGDTPDEVVRARSTVARGAGNYGVKVAAFEGQLDRFIESTQARARRQLPTPPVALPASYAKLSRLAR